MQSIFSETAREFILAKLKDIHKTAGIKIMDLYIFMMIIIIMVLLPFSTFADNGSDSDEPILYSNQELEGYKKPSDNDRSVNAASPQRKKQSKSSRAKKSKRDEEHLKKYWCSKGTRFRKKVEEAKNVYAAAEKNFSENKTSYFYKKISSSRYNTSKTDLEKAEKDLNKAEKDLNAIENEAHRDWVPPGWLRCQF